MPLDMTTRRQLLLAGSTFAVLAVIGIPAAADTASEATAEGGRDIVEMAIGDADAPVTIIEYASFTCPHCAAFHSDVLPQIKEQYVDTGKVRFVMREVYFDRPGLWASMLARCAGEDRFFGVADLLFAQQADWSRAADPNAIIESLYSIGRQAGLDREAMDACFADGDFARDLVAWYQENATADGVQSTPSFLVNGERTGNLPWNEFKSRIDAALES